MDSPNIIIIGGGVAAIAMAHTLKGKLGFSNFQVGSDKALRCSPQTFLANKQYGQIYEKSSGLGGTWESNTYPGW